MTMISVYQSQRLFVMEYLATGALLFGIWVNNLSIMQQTKQRSLNWVETLLLYSRVQGYVKVQRLIISSGNYEHLEQNGERLR